MNKYPNFIQTEGKVWLQYDLQRLWHCQKHSSFIKYRTKVGRDYILFACELQRSTLYFRLDLLVSWKNVWKLFQKVAKMLRSEPNYNKKVRKLFTLIRVVFLVMPIFFFWLPNSFLLNRWYFPKFRLWNEAEKRCFNHKMFRVFFFPSLRFICADQIVYFFFCFFYFIVSYLLWCRIESQLYCNLKQQFWSRKRRTHFGADFKLWCVKK